MKKLVLRMTAMDGCRVLRSKKSKRKIDFKSYADFAKWAEDMELNMCCGFMRLGDEYCGFKIKLENE